MDLGHQLHSEGLKSTATTSGGKGRWHAIRPLRLSLPWGSGGKHLRVVINVVLGGLLLVLTEGCLDIVFILVIFLPLGTHFHDFVLPIALPVSLLLLLGGAMAEHLLGLDG